MNISSQGVERAQALDARPAMNPYADTIVNFIQLQLQKIRPMAQVKKRSANAWPQGLAVFKRV